MMMERLNKEKNPHPKNYVLRSGFEPESLAISISAPDGEKT